MLQWVEPVSRWAGGVPLGLPWQTTGVGQGWEPAVDGTLVPWGVTRAEPFSSGQVTMRVGSEFTKAPKVGTLVNELKIDDMSSN